MTLSRLVLLFLAVKTRSEETVFARARNMQISHLLRYSQIDMLTTARYRLSEAISLSPLTASYVQKEI